MASIDLDMGDVFDDGGDLDENVAGSRPIPGFDDDDEGPMAPGSDGDGEGAQGEGGEGDEDVLNRLKDLSKGAAKKRVMRPQPKLNDERLRSDRGLPILPKVCEGVKFKGKGYERQNLRIMMGKMEHWAHRLFPKLHFDDFIDRLEKYSHKKTVMNTIKRMRMDMPILDDDYVAQYDDDGDQAPLDEAPRANNSKEDEEMEIDAEEAFEAMIQEEKARRERESALMREEEESADDVMRDIQDEDIPSFPMTSQKKLADTVPSTPTSTPTPTPTPTPTAADDKVPSSQGKSLTPAQIERMERSKRLAMERRMARMGVTPTGSKKGIGAMSLGISAKVPTFRLLDTTQAENTPLPPSPFTDAQRFESEESGKSIKTQNTESLQLQQSLSEEPAKDSDSLHLEQSVSQSMRESDSDSLHLKQTLSADSRAIDIVKAMNTPLPPSPLVHTKNNSADPEESDSLHLKQSMSDEVKSSETEILQVEQLLSENTPKTDSESLNLEQTVSEETEMETENHSESLKLKQTLSEDDQTEKASNRELSSSVKCDSETLHLKQTMLEDGDNPVPSLSKMAAADTLPVSESMECQPSESENAFEDKENVDSNKRNLSDGDNNLSLKLSVSDNESKEIDTSLDDSVIT